MSAYTMGKVLWDMNHFPQLVQQFQSDPESLLSRYPLSEEEKTALRNGDLRYLYAKGVNCMMLLVSSRLLGNLDIRDFAKAVAPPGTPSYAGVRHSPSN